MLHYFSRLVALSTAVLIFAGGLVTSTGSGLSVPDWPNTYGWFMLTFPLEKMVGGIFYEHSHRLIAGTVGFLILVLAFWLGRVEPRRWVRRLGYVALAAVIVQGLLGGITVLWYLPDAISISHASLAQVVFCLTTAIALFTSPGWKRGYRERSVATAGGRRAGSAVPADDSFTASGVDDRLLRRVALATTVAIYGQIVVGATMRHIDAGLAIPDFPLAFGQLIPPHWNTGIAVHYAHRLGAAIVSALIIATTAHVIYHHRRRRELMRPSLLLLALLTLQITLGALTIWTQKHYIINSLHVVTGGSVLATSLVLTLRAHRRRFADAAARAADETDLRNARALADRRGPAGARA
jgi:cytochrome c oxidase assembly protein subunit 15